MGNTLDRLESHWQRIGFLGSEIKLVMQRDLPMEIDGEPFLLGPCQITITRKNKARMLITERSQAAQQIQSKRV